MNWFNKNWDSIAALITGIVSVGIILYIWISSNFETSERVLITTATATVVLVIATSVYAWHTRKMAEEMKEQRKNVFRPIITFERDDTPNSLVQEGIDASTRNFTTGIRCRLCNIGVGPALEIFSNVQDANKEQQLTYFGILPANGKTNMKYFSIIGREKKYILAVMYKDIFGTKWESSINIDISEEGKGFFMEGLQIHELC